MAQIGVTSLRGIVHTEYHYVFLLASGITNDHVGMAVSLDTSAENTVKLAADGEDILGYLVTAENRTNEGINIGTVALRGGHAFAMNPTELSASPVSADIPAVGDYIVGDGSGYVKKAGGSADKRWQVVEIEGDGTSRRFVAIHV